MKSATDSQIIMKSKVVLTLAIYLLLSSCSMYNRIIIIQDDYKNQSNIKLNQTLKGYSDEMLRSTIAGSQYHIDFKHLYYSSEDGSDGYEMDVKLNTTVRAYEIEPVLYISIDGVIEQLQADNNVIKTYQQGSTTTSSEILTSTSDDSENEDEKITETTTNYSTTSSHNTFQLMQLKFRPSRSLFKRIRNASKIRFKLYIENEGIDIPFKARHKRKFNQFIDITVREL